MHGPSRASSQVIGSRWCLLLGLAWCAAAQAQQAQTAAGAEPGADERQVTLIGKLLHPKSSPWTPDLRQVLALMAETPVRRHFKSLSAEIGWGPTHPQWQRHFRGFRDDYLRFLAADAERAERGLVDSLRQAMSEDEMLALLAVADDPEMDQVLQLASRVGLDLNVAVRTANLAAAPELYAPEEVAAIRAELVKLQGRDLVMSFLAAKMQFFASKFGSPAFARYQGIVVEWLLPVATASIDDDEFRGRFAIWLSGWRQRLGL